LAKIKIILTVLLALFFISLNNAFADEGKFVLVLDPGHGGRDSGALGKKGKEKDINLAVSNLVKKYVSEEYPDVTIICTRETDVFIGLDERAAIANKAGANLFISIHANAIAKKTNIKGAEVYTFGLARSQENLDAAMRENEVIVLEDDYNQKYEGFDPKSTESYIIFQFMQNKFVEQSVIFAAMVQRELVGVARRVDRGVRQASFLVLRKATMPRVLIELDFITNPTSEEYMLSAEGQKTLARSICKAVGQYKLEAEIKSGTRNGLSDKTVEEIVPVTKKTIAENTAAKPVAVEQKTVSEKAKAEQQTVEPPVIPAASTPKIIYKIQILASKVELDPQSQNFKSYKGKAELYREDDWYKYTLGSSEKISDLTELLKTVQQEFKGAFIVSFKDGVKVPLKGK